MTQSPLPTDDSRTEPPGPSTESPKRTKVRRPVSRRTKIVLVASLLCYSLLLAEVGARAYWAIAKGVPFLQPRHMLHRFYPELRDSHVETSTITQTDDTFDVLLLGGSVLHTDFGAVAEKLRRRLSQPGHSPVRLFNLARSGHTSRDSWLKYRTLKNQRFDLVVVYHGINDVRMNNCPRDMFRDDYTHCSWYTCIERISQHPELPAVALPYTLDYLTVKLGEKLGRYAPRHRPPASWTAHGAAIKTNVTFRANLERIINSAQARGERVLLMTFAHHVASGYSEPAFRAHRLDYAAHTSAIEIWGSLENVVAAVAAHNRIVTDLARCYPNTILVDQHTLMPKDGRHFDDICHFTDAGSDKFVAHIADALEQRSPTRTVRGPLAQ